MSARYLPQRPAESRTQDLRGLRHHVTAWRGSTEPPAVLLHGFMDCGETFQFVVDAMAPMRTLFAPDWRGFGRTAWSAAGYWFPDYFADLDALLAELSPDSPVDLVGHSMGGNIALVYAGLRPDRVRRVVSLEGFGLQGATADLAPARYRDWLQQLQKTEPATVFPSAAAFVQVLLKRNPRLRADRAAFIANAWAETLPDGRMRVRFDPAHRRVNPILYRRDEAQACWREIRAPVLYVAGTESDFSRRLHGAGDPDVMRRFIPQLEPCIVPGAGHMLHHDQPERVAEVIQRFLDA
jgi:pimeloyl-ACP methyl ester carboxylesterase